MRHNTTLKDIAKDIGYSVTTLSKVERGLINNPYSYWHAYCNYFGVDANKYLNLTELKENTVREKIDKIMALSGSSSVASAGRLLGVKENCIQEWYKVNRSIKEHILDNWLNGQKKS